MKKLFLTLNFIAIPFIFFSQTCPSFGNSSVGTNPSTYYPGQGTVTVGSTSITVGAASGSTAITAGDLVLIIQMQGTEINSANTNSYGNGVSGGFGNGYLNNANNRAGNMEFAIATNSVGLGGGTLTISSGTVNSYSNANYGTFGQYRFQVIRFPVYFNATLTANLSAPNWNGTTGGVLVVYARNNFSFNSFSLSASGTGFRGGASRQLSGGAGANTDYRTAASINTNGAKGEGISGTPQYLNNNGTILNTGVEGYPNGSQGQGAPGNAGGGGTDGNPGANDQNTGGGGGGNGGAGGKGGNAWSSNLTRGGEPGASFAQNTARRLVMGGGGGAGTTNNGTGTPGSGFASSGAAGGGIVLLFANSIISTGTINVSGTNANNTVSNDGSGGGGAGGSALVFSGSGHSNVTVLARGGNGGTNTGGGAQHGPGGGAGGGVVYSNGTLNGSTSVTGGTAGTTAGGGNFGASAGAVGVLIQSTTTAQVPQFGNSCILLPVQLTNFTVASRRNDAILNWVAENEVNFKEYEVQQSKNGIDFVTIAVIPGSNLSLAHQYQYVDVNAALSGDRIYYRLKMTDIDQRFTYSDIRQVKFDGSALLDIRPTVVNKGTPVVITLSANFASAHVITVTDTNGKLIRQQTQTSGNRFVLSTDGLAAGVYLVRLSGDEVNRSVKFLVN